MTHKNFYDRLFDTSSGDATTMKTLLISSMPSPASTSTPKSSKTTFPSTFLVVPSSDEHKSGLNGGQLKRDEKYHHRPQSANATMLTSCDHPSKSCPSVFDEEIGPKEGKIDDVKAESIFSMKSLTLIFFVFHSTLSVCLLRYVRFRDVKVMYAAPAALFVGELVKIGLSVIFLSWESKSVKKALKLIYVGTVIEWRECLKASVASACYVFQNLLYYYSISYLDATLLLVTQQIKILTTALFAVLLLKKRLSLVQWSSMVVLIFGIILVQWKVEKKAAGVVENNTTTASSVEGTTVFLSTTTPYYPLPNPLNLSPGIIGLIMVLIASILSGFTGIYLEKMFKNSTLSLWTRNFQLAVFSIPLLLCLAMITDYDQITNGGLFNGFDTWVFAVSFVFGVHGLIVALLLKHASSILKCFASGFVIAMTSIVSIFLFNKWPSYLFVIGTLIILVAVFLYSNFPYKQKTIVLGKIRPV